MKTSFFNQNIKVSTHFLIIIVSASFIFAACKPKPKKKISTAEKAPLAVRVTPVKQGVFEKKAAYIGTVKSLKEMKIYARTNGTIISMIKKEGEIVKKGEKIAKISVPDMRKKLQRLNSEIRRAKMESAYLCYMKKKDEALYKDKVIPKTKLDYSTLKCDSSRQALQTARASYEELRVISGRSVERSPSDGVVLKRFSESGEHIFPGKPLMLIGTRGKEIVVNVSEQDIESGIKIGTEVKVKIQKSGLKKAEILKLAVTRINPTAWGPGRLVETGIKLPEKFNDMLYGSSVEVEFVLETHENSNYVPVTALKKEDSGFYIFTVEKNTSKKIRIIKGLEENGFVEIVKPALPAAKVIISNIDSLKDGSKIYPVEIKNVK